MKKFLNKVTVFTLIITLVLLSGCSKKAVTQENTLIVSEISQNLEGDLTIKLQNDDVVIADKENYDNILECRINESDWKSAVRYQDDGYLIVQYNSIEGKPLVGETLIIDLRLGAYTKNRTDYLASPGLSDKLMVKFKRCLTNAEDLPYFTGIYDKDLRNLFTTQDTGVVPEEHLNSVQYPIYGDDQQICGSKFYDYIYMQIEDKLVFKELEILDNRNEDGEVVFNLKNIKDNELKIAQSHKRSKDDEPGSTFSLIRKLNWQPITRDGLLINTFESYPSGNEGADVDELFSFYVIISETSDITDSLVSHSVFNFYH